MLSERRKGFLKQLLGSLGLKSESGMQSTKPAQRYSRRRNRGLQLERLENREVFAVNVAMIGMQMHIEGDNQNNAISVENAGRLGLSRSCKALRS